MAQYGIPYKRCNVEADQPWLTVADHQHCEELGREFLGKIDMESWKIDSLYQRAEEGDEEAYKELYPFGHYVLTPDFRVVREPNLMRWAIFLERANRTIDNTLICKGGEVDFGDRPSFKTQETFVSTVFIGVADSELFETMLFGGPLNQTAWRSDTLIEAKKCHWEAVNLGHKMNRYIKQHGKQFRKDWIRLDNFWRLGRLRGEPWMEKHFKVMARVYRRLMRAPGPPPIPQPNILLNLHQMFVARETLAK